MHRNDSGIFNCSWDELFINGIDLSRRWNLYTIKYIEFLEFHKQFNEISWFYYLTTSRIDPKIRCMVYDSSVMCCVNLSPNKIEKKNLWWIIRKLNGDDQDNKQCRMQNNRSNCSLSFPWDNNIIPGTHVTTHHVKKKKTTDELVLVLGPGLMLTHLLSILINRWFGSFLAKQNSNETKKLNVNWTNRVFNWIFLFFYKFSVS